MTDYYLLDHPNRYGPHYVTHRAGNPIQAIVMHITATPGGESMNPNRDSSARNVAKYAATTDRVVSWHAGADTQEYLYLLPASYTAWHARGWSRRTWGIEISKIHTDWRSMPGWWVERTLENAAKATAPIVAEHRIPTVKITKSQYDRGERGFISHGDLDYTRRTDPGIVRGVDTFPWDRFLARVSFLASGGPDPVPQPAPAPIGDDDMWTLYQIEGTIEQFLVGPTLFAVNPTLKAKLVAAKKIVNPDAPVMLTAAELFRLSEQRLGSAA